MSLRLSREAILAVYAQGPEAVVALVEGLLARADALEARVAALEAGQAKDRHNSGKPPSTDVTRAGRVPRSLRGKSGRSAGGQPGHPGRTLALRATPDVLEVHAPDACATCGAAYVPAAPSARWRASAGRCSSCRRCAWCARSTAWPSARARAAGP